MRYEICYYVILLFETVKLFVKGNKSVTELLHLYVVSSVLLSNVHFLLGLIISLHRVHSPLYTPR